MKTRINLYTAEFQPRLQVLTLSFVLIIWLILSVIMGAVYYFEVAKQDEQQQKLTIVEQQNLQQEELLLALQEQLSARKDDPLLVQAIEQNQRDIELKQRVLTHLAGQESLKSNGFSDLMLGLAAHHQSGLWLTRVSLDDKKVSIEGSAADSVTIPQWVSKLGQTRHFSGQEFSTTKLFRDAAQQLHFTLNSQSAEESAKGQVNEQ